MMMRKWLIALAFVLMAVVPCSALDVGLSSWPSTADIITCDPGVTSFTPQNGSTYLGQTFKAVESGNLDKIFVYITGRTDRSYELRLYNLGVQTTIPSNYTGLIIGGNMLGSGSSLVWNSSDLSTSTMKVFEFDFQGLEEALLTAGNTYAFEITTNGSTLAWMRGGSVPNPYLDGDSYTNGGQTDGRGRDQFMQVVMTPEPMTICFLGLGAMAVLRRKR
ncbi:MAG: hypothetical protein WC962_06385 [Phycisphaerae bacterium]